MVKCRIFIASSSRTQTLAEKLKDALETDYCMARLWSEESQGQTSSTIVEMLEKATTKYDFAVIVLAKDDVLVRETGDTLKARDNCVFEAGLFLSAIGRRRCFFVNSVEQRDLPSDLGGIISIPFQEPANLTDRDACAEAIGRVSSTIKDTVSRLGSLERKFLSQKELMERQKLHTRGGELHEDQVVVTAIQPVGLDYGPALQVWTNIDGGVRYVYFFFGNFDGAQKTCKLLQKMLLAPMLDPHKASEYQYLQSEVAKGPNQDKILESLEKICELQSLKIYFLPETPRLQFCIHNANSVDGAILYFKQGEDTWIQWAEGSDAYDFWKEVEEDRCLSSTVSRGVFRSARGFDMKKNAFCNTLNIEIKRHFPGIEKRVTELCFDETLPC
jgi:Predicted nucleotide-binding protein containing TIR-like domain